MPLQLTAADLDKLKSKELANAIRKLHAAKTLTNAERALLAQSADAPLLKSGYAPNWNDLATALGVSRKALKNWRDDPRYTPQLPVARADGRHDVAAWAAFMVANGLKQADEQVGETSGASKPAEGSPEGRCGGSEQSPQFPVGSESQWKKKLLEQKVAHAEVETGKLRGELLVATELEIPLGSTFVAIQNKYVTFAERVAPMVAGFTDVQEVMGIIRDEMDADLKGLHAADYLADVETVVAELPIATDDTRALVIEAARETLRRIGRRVIANALRVPEDLLDAVTGQVTDEAAEDHASAKSFPKPDGVGELPRSQSEPAKSETQPTAPFHPAKAKVRGDHKAKTAAKPALVKRKRNAERKPSAKPARKKRNRKTP